MKKTSYKIPIFLPVRVKYRFNFTKNGFLIFRGAFRFLKVNAFLWWWETRRYTVAKVFSNLAATHPKKIAYIIEDQEWTYQQVTLIDYKT